MGAVKVRESVIADEEMVDSGGSTVYVSLFVHCVIVIMVLSE